MNDKIKQLHNASWKNVSELVAGMKIAVPDIEDGFSWDEVVTIKPVGREDMNSTAGRRLRFPKKTGVLIKFLLLLISLTGRRVYLTC